MLKEILILVKIKIVKSFVAKSIIDESTISHFLVSCTIITYIGTKNGDV